MRIKATDAGRGLSNLLSRAAAGETIEIHRHGEVVAVVSPPRRSLVPGDVLLQTLKRIPRPDGGFGADMRGLAAVTRRPGVMRHRVD
ncbi:MAG: type II toxin-antitoxin system prevent-host-death family antitoxin [Candidatus Dormibacteraeota bacterium]|nr:type II toxin-antitoxin system prevent-host-death family antitoxin [Candidatus Dormibacteraeota bacterium]MBV9526114.1 type II toxin-antitoxin system prevent-host-death family antitoxin [Candidatus Dormibacteraeota bacterium]